MNDMVSIRKMRPWDAGSGQAFGLGLGTVFSAIGASAAAFDVFLRGDNQVSLTAREGRQHFADDRFALLFGVIPKARVLTSGPRDLPKQSL